MMQSITGKTELTLFLLCISQAVFSQFIESFESNSIDPGWEVSSGDGNAKIKFERHDGFGTISIDATNDDLNIWWALIRLQVPELDMEKLVQPNYELRVEAKIKVSDSPRRVNLHFNHTRTTDFHSHLKEYDIRDSSNWHIISMTTNDFKVRREDRVNVQLALMDWGTDKYTVDIQYIKVDVVDKYRVDADLGNPQDYHPPVPKLETFTNSIKLVQSITLDKQYPDKNFNNWYDPLSAAGKLLSVNQSQIAVLKGDFTKFKNHRPSGWGVLKVRLHHLEHSSDFKKDFGIVRLVEIIGGPKVWKEEEITYQNFTSGKAPVFNGQMIIDVNPANSINGEVYFTLSEAVLNRLFSGETEGLALFPLGAITASFYSSNSKSIDNAPEIYFNTK